MYKELVVRSWEEPGEMKEAPFKRLIKPLFGPERRGVPVMNANIVYIDPHSGTPYHNHVIGEMIYIVTGRGEGLLGDECFPLEPDVIFFAPAGVFHHIRNTSGETMKLFTVFAPGMNREKQKSLVQIRDVPAEVRPLE